MNKPYDGVSFISMGVVVPSQSTTEMTGKYTLVLHNAYVDML